MSNRLAEIEEAFEALREMAIPTDGIDPGNESEQMVREFKERAGIDPLTAAPK